MYPITFGNNVSRHLNFRYMSKWMDWYLTTTKHSNTRIACLRVEVEHAQKLHGKFRISSWRPLHVIVMFRAKEIIGSLSMSQGITRVGPLGLFPCISVLEANMRCRKEDRTYLVCKNTCYFLWNAFIFDGCQCSQCSWVVTTPAKYERYIW